MFTGKKLFYAAIFFLPLFLYRWRIGNGASFSISDILMIASFIPFLLFPERIKLREIAFPVSLIIFILLFETFVFVLNNGFIYIQTKLFLEIGTYWILLFIVSNQYVKNYNDIVILLKTIAYSSVWVLYGMALHLYGLLSGYLWKMVPFGKELHVSLPSVRIDYLYASGTGTMEGIRRFCFPFSYSSSGAGVSAAIILLVSLVVYLRLERRSFILPFLILGDLLYVVMTLSRTAWIMIATGVIFIFLSNLMNKKPMISKMLLMLFLATLAYISLSSFINIKIFSLVKNRLYGNYWSEISTKEHLKTMDYALNLFGERPIFGSGLGGYKYSRYIKLGQIFGGQHPHDDYLLFLSEGGLIGFAAFVTLLFFPVFYFCYFKKNVKKYNRLYIIYNSIVFIQLAVYMGLITYNYLSGFLTILIFLSWKLVSITQKIQANLDIKANS